GILLGRDSRFHTLFLMVTGISYLAASLIYASMPTAIWAVIITYITLIPYLSMLVWILGRFLVVVQTITRDVLYAAVALYLLLGAIFVPIYGLLDFIIPNSFRDGTFPDAPVQWQQFVYFSYTTLTSSGYGDILPVSWWARSFANLEMITGVLFITIVMSRLVSLYNSDK
ncbi:MAG TPA: potassium channel family protein, partial [Anaerolineales bacterium]|nr:potassium channel family protein [Anaerolineales bacterium]